jgi:hypothetical protein
VSIIPQDAGPPDAGGPPDLPLPPDGATITSKDSGGQLDHVRTAIMALQIFAEHSHDDVEIHAVHKCITALQKILADHASDRDAAMGTTPALKHVRRQAAGY